jgi:hypothetical protein
MAAPAIQTMRHIKGERHPETCPVALNHGSEQMLSVHFFRTIGLGSRGALAFGELVGLDGRGGHPTQLDLNLPRFVVPAEACRPDTAARAIARLHWP